MKCRHGEEMTARGVAVMVGMLVALACVGSDGVVAVATPFASYYEAGNPAGFDIWSDARVVHDAMERIHRPSRGASRPFFESITSAFSDAEKSAFDRMHSGMLPDSGMDVATDMPTKIPLSLRVCDAGEEPAVTSATMHVNSMAMTLDLKHIKAKLELGASLDSDVDNELTHHTIVTVDDVSMGGFAMSPMVLYDLTGSVCQLYDNVLGCPLSGGNITMEKKVKVPGLDAVSSLPRRLYNAQVKLYDKDQLVSCMHLYLDLRPDDVKAAKPAPGSKQIGEPLPKKDAASKDTAAGVHAKSTAHTDALASAAATAAAGSAETGNGSPGENTASANGVNNTSDASNAAAGVAVDAGLGGEGGFNASNTSDTAEVGGVASMFIPEAVSNAISGLRQGVTGSAGAAASGSGVAVKNDKVNFDYTSTPQDETAVLQQLQLKNLQEQLDRQVELNRQQQARYDALERSLHGLQTSEIEKLKSQLAELMSVKKEEEEHIKEQKNSVEREQQLYSQISQMYGEYHIPSYQLPVVAPPSEAAELGGMPQQVHHAPPAGVLAQLKGATPQQPMLPLRGGADNAMLRETVIAPPAPIAAPPAVPSVSAPVEGTALQMAVPPPVVGPPVALAGAAAMPAQAVEAPQQLATEVPGGAGSTRGSTAAAEAEDTPAYAKSVYELFNDAEQALLSPYSTANKVATAPVSTLAHGANEMFWMMQKGAVHGEAALYDEVADTMSNFMGGAGGTGGAKAEVPLQAVDVPRQVSA